MTGPRALPRLHIVTSSAVLSDVDFESRTRTLLERLARDFAPLEPSGQVHSGIGIPATVALHLRGAIPARRLHDLAVALHPAVRAAGGILLVNDRVDVARTSRVDGAHLPSHGIGASAARAQLGPRATLGASVHDAPGARAADGADFHIFGNVWETGSHPGRPAAGLHALAALVSHPEAPPTLAIGGVTPERVHEVAAVGGHGVAVLSGIWSDASPAEAAIRYLEAVFDAYSGADG